MDMKRNRSRRGMNKKLMTLKATAAAVMTLNSGVASAVNCPLTISSSIAGVCTFNTNSSVTVTNTGTVQGIAMNSYQPSNSFITIDTGGVITGGGNAISLTGNSVLSGSISNSGSITGANNGIGIFTSATVSGGITNSGTINGGATAGIGLFSATVNGGISNSGSISSSQVGILIAAGSSSSIALISNPSTLNGGISNTGSIIATDANGFGIGVFSNASIAGGISNAGTITGGSTSGAGITVNAASVANGISNNGAINGYLGIVIVNGSTVSGDISNSGTITAPLAAGIGVISGSTVSGDISNSGTINANTGIGVSNATISGGISNSGTIQGSTYAVHITDSSVSGLDIIGQHARLIGNVLATGTAVNITSGAVFTSEGAFNVDTFNIASGAVFNMANEIAAAGGVHNAGTLSTASGTTQTIAGNYTQETNGVYRLGATSVSNYGKLHATGQASLAASGAINVQVQPGALFHNGDVLTNVISGDTFVAPTNGYTVTDNSFIYQFIANTNTTNGVDLSTEINPSASLACRGSYCAGASSAILGQLAKGNATFAPYTAVPTASAFATAASQATPELTNENLQITQLVARTVLDELPMWSSLRGASGGDAMLTQPGKIWFKPYGGSATQNKRNTVNGYTASVYGLIVGGDVELPQAWMLGGAVAAGGENLNGKAVLSDQSIHSAQYQAIIYTSKFLPHHTYFAAQALGGYGDNNTKRYIPLYASSAKGNYHSWFTDISAQFGWSHPLNNCLVITPAVTASYLYINQGSYREYGSLMDLSVRSNSNSAFVVGADANIAYRAGTFANQQDLTLTGHAGVDYDVIHNQPSTISTFVAGGPSFFTYGIQYSGAAFRGGIGLALANPTKPLSFNLNGDVQAGNNGYNTVYTATIQYKL